MEKDPKVFQKEVQERLTLLNCGLVEISQEQVRLNEKHNEGAADLQLNLCNPFILFQDLENRKLQYFKNQMCSDFVMFEYVEDNWRLHIFELKRTVGKKEWRRTKQQFLGALQNALALAGVLNINVNLQCIHVYTVFRNDKLNQYMNPAKLRQRMYEKSVSEQQEGYCDWNNKKIISQVP